MFNAFLDGVCKLRVGDLNEREYRPLGRHCGFISTFKKSPSGALRRAFSRSIDAPDEKFEREMKRVIYCDFTRIAGRDGDAFSRSIDREIRALMTKAERFRLRAVATPSGFRPVLELTRRTVRENMVIKVCVFSVELQVTWTDVWCSRSARASLHPCQRRFVGSFGS